MGFIWLKNLQIIGISELCIEKEPSGMMDIIIEPNTICLALLTPLCSLVQCWNVGKTVSA